jgi:hypothetical protein
LERRICESSVEERRGRVATVCMAILRIDSGRSSSRRVGLGRRLLRGGVGDGIELLDDHRR